MYFVIPLYIDVIYFFLIATATTVIYPLSLHDALPISWSTRAADSDRGCSARVAPRSADPRRPQVAPVTAERRVPRLADAPQAEQTGGRKDQVGRPNRQERRHQQAISQLLAPNESDIVDREHRDA